MMSNDIIDDDIETIIKSKIKWNVLKNKVILITGATGLIGSYLCRTLYVVNRRFRLNLKMILLIRDKDKIKNLTFLKKSNFSKFIVCDICNPESIKSLKPNFIIHAASIASPKFYDLKAIETIDPNVLATKNLLELAKKNSSTFLFLSSGAIYGEIKKKKLVSENDYFSINPSRINSCYSLSKKMGEVYCFNYKRIFKMDIKIARIFHTFGPGLSKGDGRVFSDIIDGISVKKTISINSDGSAIRSFCYISDTVTALFILLLSKSKSIEYNIGNPKNVYSIKKLAKKLKKYMPVNISNIIFNSKIIKNKRYVKSHIKYTVPDIGKIKKEFGWFPKVCVEEAFKKTITSRIKYEE